MNEQIRDVLIAALNVVHYRCGDVDTEDGSFATTGLDEMIGLEQALCEAFDIGSDSVNPALMLPLIEAAHEAAAQIPDILAELRERVDKHGYDLVARSPFTPEVAEEFEPAYKAELQRRAMAEDMSDWRNWRAGDLVMLKESVAEGYVFRHGKPYKVESTHSGGYRIRYDGHQFHYYDIETRVNDFLFHSRPA